MSASLEHEKRARANERAAALEAAQGGDSAAAAAAAQLQGARDRVEELEAMHLSSDRTIRELRSEKETLLAWLRQEGVGVALIDVKVVEPSERPRGYVRVRVALVGQAVDAKVQHCSKFDTSSFPGSTNTGTSPVQGQPCRRNHWNGLLRSRWLRHASSTVGILLLRA